LKSLKIPDGDNCLVVNTELRNLLAETGAYMKITDCRSFVVTFNGGVLMSMSPEFFLTQRPNFWPTNDN